MTKKKRKAIRDFLEKASKYMGISDFDITIRYVDERNGCQADIGTQLEYLNATITIYTSFWGNDRWEMEHTLIHELSHIITDPLYKKAIDGITNPCIDWLEEMREKTTEQVARITHKGIKFKLDI